MAEEFTIIASDADLIKLPVLFKGGFGCRVEFDGTQCDFTHLEATRGDVRLVFQLMRKDRAGHVFDDVIDGLSGWTNSLANVDEVGRKQVLHRLSRCPLLLRGTAEPDVTSRADVQEMIGGAASILRGLIRYGDKVLSPKGSVVIAPEMLSRIRTVGHEIPEDLLARLKSADETGDQLSAIGGALEFLRSHKAFKSQFTLNAPVSHAAMTAFESDGRITLPESYRRFLMELGNGGCGPHYGLFKLGEMDDGFGHAAWPDQLFGNLDRPFPHTQAWNDHGGDPDTGGENFDKNLSLFERKNQSKEHIPGAIPICHMGCALRLLLVVTGPERGNIWEDRRAEHSGLVPVITPSGERLTFLRWYMDWLLEVLATRIDRVMLPPYPR